MISYITISQFFCMCVVSTNKTLFATRFMRFRLDCDVTSTFQKATNSDITQPIKKKEKNRVFTVID